MIVESYEDVIILSGAMRSNQWETLHTAISLTLKRHASGVIIDCSGLIECTTKGADTFHSVMEFLKDHDARVIVAAVPEQVMEVLKQVPDVRSQLPIVATVEEARRSLDLLLYEAPKKKAKASIVQIVIVVQGKPCDSEVIKVGSELATGLSGNVRLLFPLIVPRDLPLQAALNEEEELARTTLAEADRSLKIEGVDHTLVLERGRDIASAIAAALQEAPATHVLVGLSSTESHQDDTGKMVRSVLAKVNSAVLFVRGPL
ncbi:MAG: hypothetical protein JNK63_00165 [Chthonomonas sp.]|nr:hypothetical protein [Chthonomonas sp.]